MQNHIQFTLSICLLTLLAAPSLVSAQQSDRPNIVPVSYTHLTLPTTPYV